MIRTLDRLHAAARAVPALARLVIISRVLLALAFFPTGLVKLLGMRFTTLPTTTGPGAFFEAMYQTGWYWNVIGFAQVAAALLLLIPATRTLGAVAFFPILVNIVAVTWSVDFGLTAWITTLMLAANLLLLAWDWHRLRGLFVEPEGARLQPSPALPRIERVGYAVGTTAAMVVMIGTRDFELPMVVFYAGLAGTVIAAALVALGWMRAARGSTA